MAERRVDCAADAALCGNKKTRQRRVYLLLSFLDVKDNKTHKYIDIYIY